LKKPFLVGLCLSLIFTSAIANAQKSASDALRRDMDTARRKVYPALVNITVVTRYFQGGRSLRGPAGGSGVIVTPQGHVLTNFHVAGHTTRITCTLPDGEAIEASVVTHDPLTDLSVLKLRTEKRSNKSPLPYAHLGNSDALQVGDYVMAMGNPLMLSSSMTLGIVSNTKRVFTDFIGTEIEDQDLDSGEKTGIFTRWIQHDALILPGNSGGPLVNLRGEVVGINELGGNGVGFAIPSNIASSVLRQALAYGTVKRGWLGITVLPVSKLGRDSGALISSLLPGSPADKAGLKAGDILLSLNGQPVNVRFFEEVPVFYQRVASLQAGQPISARVLRGNAPRAINATVIPMEKYNGEEAEVRDMGVTAMEITGPMALAARYPDKSGVLLTGVRSGYPFEASQPKLNPGDVILSVDGKPTNNLSAFRAALAGKKKRVFPVTYRHGTESLVSIVKVEDDKPQEEGGELPKPWLGIKTQVLTTELATALNVPDAKGFRVTQVFPATAASKAGLRQGDILTALNGNKLEAYRLQDAGDLKRAVEELTIGEKAEITLLRNGKEVKLNVPLEEPPAPVEKAKKIKQKEFEFAARDITPLDRFENRWSKDQMGVLVTEVTPGGWAQMAGLRVDDLIMQINNQATSTADAFEKQMGNMLKTHPKVVRIFVLRGSQTHFVFIEPDWSKLTSGK
jgi:serine protease Do